LTRDTIRQMPQQDNYFHDQIQVRANSARAGYSTTARIKCPICSDHRKNKHDRSMAVTFFSDRLVYLCHHCEEKGVIPHEKKEWKPKRTYPKVQVKDAPRSPAIDWLIRERKIDPDVVKQFGVISTRKYFQKLQREADCVGFPFYNETEVYAVKYRTSGGDKAHTQEGAGGAQSFFGIEKVRPEAKTLIICEGEIDQLSLVTAGFIDSVSVPNGAPMKASEGEVDPTNDRKYGFVWAAKDLLKQVDKVILAVDMDGPGQALAEELARRIGKVKCWQVDWPEDCKDPNDILVKHGPDKLVEVIGDSKPWPITGLFDVDHYADQVNQIYERGHQRGLSTGIDSVDNLFTICPGQLSIVTGHPSSGKSEFIDQIMVNMAESYDWSFAVCSFENDPPTHIIKLMEKHAGVPFHDGPSMRMTREELAEARDWCGRHFFFVEQNDGEPASIESILERAQAAILRYGVRGLVIDPYNYVDIDKSKVSETEAISQMLTRCRLFARAHDIHVWFIAHPAKMMRDGGEFPAPKGYDISGSAAWFAKADLGVTVHRKPDTHLSEIHCWKVRFKWVGQQGVTDLEYFKSTGQYREAINYAEL